MLTIIKIQEGYCVVDLDEDTELFDSLEEAEQLIGNVILERSNRSTQNRLKLKKKKYDLKNKKGENVESYHYGRIAARAHHDIKNAKDKDDLVSRKRIFNMFVKAGKDAKKNPI